mmetsp:Transcript_60675/g.67895  ORF Transcript_60675/g.67895 Transcript_60675/m.67895 type:complete len:186 (+) Transcript_60675:82-639(+)|eukprot:CAMPEP_0170800266 /NCGR_PEP_ID=MMETSP0733-20121128/27680_1 /TAXON_ID=186038 /ORGANISM="Fragilariopsis kerguelensis, Strain L26-C5" /LENGTH=185 /DNA_ID=CAMNT_0011152439 /DNA_START=87 /DNA_END=644 /DNA_ORIENTATION=+
MLARTASSITRVARRRMQNPSPVVTRGLKGVGKNESDEDHLKNNDSTIPFGIGNWLGEKSDHLIPTDKQHDTRPKHMPDFFPEDVKKEMKELGLDGIEDLDELEQKNIDGYNDLGLVPPEGTGTYASPILIPSRRTSRVVGYQDPDSHAMFWFTIHNDNGTYYIKDLGLFFKMLPIPSDEEASAH